MNYFSIFYFSGLIIYLALVIIRGIIKLDYFNELCKEESLKIKDEIRQNLYTYTELILSHFVVWTFNIKLNKENYRIELFNDLLNTTGSFGLFLTCLIIWPVPVSCFISVTLLSIISKLIHSIVKKFREIK